MLKQQLLFSTTCYQVTFDADDGARWCYHVPATGQSIAIGLPVFEIDGQRCPLALTALTAVAPAHILRNGVREYRFAGALREQPELTLEFVARVAEDNPVLRFHYVLHSTAAHRLTKGGGRDALRYLALVLPAEASLSEVQFSAFNEMVHSYCLVENRLDERVFAGSMACMGPLLVWQQGEQAALVAYEHGSQVPDAFLSFQCSPAREVHLQAVKGNYAHRQPLDAAHPFTTLWCQLAAQQGGEAELAGAYRQYILRYQSENLASRAPNIYYNTWAYQERNQAWNGREFLTSMHQQRILEEIEVAHRMGIEVFVIDTGWYEKTGDWRVNLARFPDGLRAVREKLAGYGMKLGLWFSPTLAAVSSEMHRTHADCLMSWQGKIPDPPRSGRRKRASLSAWSAVMRTPSRMS